jgi:putative endonuclease
MENDSNCLLLVSAIKPIRSREMGYVYIITNTMRTTIYIGVTNNIKRRILEHKCGVGSKFSHRYHLTVLIYFESTDRIIDAIAREKQLKNWHSDWKWNLAKQANPKLNDLAEGWYTREEIENYRQMFTEE